MAKRKKAAALKTASSASVVRDRLSSFLGYSHSGQRDLYSVFGYERQVDVRSLYEMYKRNDIANRIIRAFPQATWRDAPLIGDEQGDGVEEENADTFSPFALACHEFFAKFRATSYLERVDRLSGIGRFAVLFMGFRDGKPTNSPVQGDAPLLFMSPYLGEVSASISRWDTDTQSPRFGLPELYTLQGNNLDGETRTPVKSMTVHHSRVLHVSEFLDQDEVMGLPRLMPIYNRLKDLEKTVGGSAETFWLTANRGMLLKFDKDAALGPEDLQAIKDQAEEFQHQLRRYLVGTGVEADILGSEAPDPSMNVSALLDLIAGTVGMPKRILIGSERGELASGQDENNWIQRIDERRRNFAATMILRPFIQKMIDTGNLPMPSNEPKVIEEKDPITLPAPPKPKMPFGNKRIKLHVEKDEDKADFWCEWPPPVLGEAEMAAVALQKTQAIVAYSNSPTGAIIVPPQEWRRDIMRMPPESEYDPPEIEEPIDETDPNLVDDPEGDEGKEPVANATPRTLYAYRKVTNTVALRAWAKEQGLTPQNDLHVTIAYSRAKFDWMKVNEPYRWKEGDEGTEEMLVQSGGTRLLEVYGPGRGGETKGQYALALLFKSNDIEYRHNQIMNAGGSHDYSGYEPHITIAWFDEKPHLSKLTAYRGAIALGREEWEEIT